MAGKPISQVFSERMRAVREDKRVNLRELAAKLKDEHGFAIDYTTLHKIETGSRQVKLDEVFAIAAALDCPPPLLLLPIGTDDRVQVTAKSVIDPTLAWDWLAGVAPLASSEQKAIHSSEWWRTAEPLRMYAQLREKQRSVRIFEAMVDKRVATGATEAEKEAREGLAEALDELQALVTEMKKAGLKLPRFPKEWKV